MKPSSPFLSVQEDRMFYLFISRAGGYSQAVCSCLQELVFFNGRTLLSPSSLMLDTKTMQSSAGHGGRCMAHE